MLTETKNKRLGLVLAVLPPRLRRELSGLARRTVYEIREIRLRADGLSTVCVGVGSFPLYSRLTAGELESTVDRVCRGSRFAYRDGMREGYIPFDGGIRVAVAGEAGYQDGRMVGIGEISTLSFRIPTGGCDFAPELHRGWLSAGGGNMLITAPPAGGKTSALRALAAIIGSGRGARRVVVVDERCEFDPEDYRGMSVDILRGYKRAAGTELAVRTMSPEVLLVDEIASVADADAVRSAFGVGLPVIATAHGKSASDALLRDYLSPLAVSGGFSLFSSVMRRGAGFFATAPCAL